LGALSLFLGRFSISSSLFLFSIAF
jgi:hypothetical protein